MLKVKTETGYYKMLDGATCPMWIKKFNNQGLITQYRDYWQCGQPYWTYDYEYDSSGKCIRSYISSYKDDFKRIAMRHKFNDKGQLIERAATDTTKYPTIEQFSYDSLGNITKQTFIGLNKYGEKHLWSKTWHGDETYKIIDKEEMFDQYNELKWTVIRHYEYYP